jgi:hypothetical protein
MVALHQLPLKRKNTEAVPAVSARIGNAAIRTALTNAAPEPQYSNGISGAQSQVTRKVCRIVSGGLRRALSQLSGRRLEQDFARDV